MNIGLYITTARKAKAQAKIQNYKNGRTRYIYKQEGGGFFWLYNTNIFNLMKILRSVSLKLEIGNGCAENLLVHLIMDTY